LECYITIEGNNNEEEPRNVKVSGIEGECDVLGPSLESDTYAKPLRV
jgi:hypothetical protein